MNNDSLINLRRALNEVGEEFHRASSKQAAGALALKEQSDHLANLGTHLLVLDWLLQDQEREHKDN